MKILLQDGKTRRYLAQGGDWSDTLDSALIFGDLAGARRYGTQHGLSNTRIVALMGKPAASFRPSPVRAGDSL